VLEATETQTQEVRPSAVAAVAANRAGPGPTSTNHIDPHSSGAVKMKKRRRVEKQRCDAVATGEVPCSATAQDMTVGREGIIPCAVPPEISPQASSRLTNMFVLSNAVLLVLCHADVRLVCRESLPSGRQTSSRRRRKRSLGVVKVRVTCRCE
jgi:hypothetical protein